MAYDEGLYIRLRDVMASEPDVSERRMFGGVGFFTGGNMAVGVVGDQLMARVGADAYETALQEPHVAVFDMTGKPMKGWVRVEADGITEDADLQAWADRCLTFARSLPVK